MMTFRYCPAQRWRQTTCNIVFIAAYLAALDEVRRTGRRVPLSGGWYVSNPSHDLE
jgi:hypothetical protein